jgi:MvdD pre-ATP grasp domain
VKESTRVSASSRKNKTLLILTNREDFAADYLILELRRRGLSYFRLNGDRPDDYQFLFETTKTSCRRMVRSKSVELDLNSVTAVWYRRAVRPVLSRLADHRNSMIQVKWVPGGRSSRLDGLREESVRRGVEPTLIRTRLVPVLAFYLAWTLAIVPGVNAQSGEWTKLAGRKVLAVAPSGDMFLSLDGFGLQTSLDGSSWVEVGHGGRRISGVAVFGDSTLAYSTVFNSGTYLNGDFLISHNLGRDWVRPCPQGVGLNCDFDNFPRAFFDSRGTIWMSREWDARGRDDEEWGIYFLDPSAGWTLVYNRRTDYNIRITPNDDIWAHQAQVVTVSSDYGASWASTSVPCVEGRNSTLNIIQAEGAERVLLYVFPDGPRYTAGFKLLSVGGTDCTPVLEGVLGAVGLSDGRIVTYWASKDTIRIYEDLSLTDYFEVPAPPGLKDTYTRFWVVGNRLVVSHSTGTYRYEGEHRATAIESRPVLPTSAFFPNPFRDWIAIEGLPPSGEVTAYDMLGRRSALQWDGGRLDTSHLPPGVYVLRVSGMHEAAVVVKSGRK